MSKITKFPALQAGLKWDEVPDTADGLHLQVEEVAVVEAAFVAAVGVPKLTTELETATEALATANTTIDGLNNKVNTLNEAAVTATATIKDLEAKVALLGKQSSGKGTKLAIGKDAKDDEKPVPSYLDPNNPANQFADSRVKQKITV